MQLAGQSMMLDAQLVRASRAPIRLRLQFLVQKYPVLIQVLFGRPSAIRLANNAVLIRDLSGLGTLQSTILDVYETLILANLFSRPNPVIVDVGANIGQFTNAVKLFYPDARVIAFEPDPEVFADLETNTAGLSNVTLHNEALGSEAGMLLFHRRVLSGMSSFLELSGARIPRHRSLRDPGRRPKEWHRPYASPLARSKLEYVRRRTLCGGNASANSVPPSRTESRSEVRRTQSSAPSNDPRHRSNGACGQVRPPVGRCWASGLPGRIVGVAACNDLTPQR